MMQRTLVIFAKEPHAGRVKSRLGRGIGMTAAAWWYRHQTARLLRELGGDPRWVIKLAVTPDRSAITGRCWPTDLERFAQGPGDLGQRMERAFRHAPPGPVVIIGSDIPDVRRRHIASAFHALGPHEGVIGPAKDGGFWLIGLKRGARPMPPGLFRGVRWSGPHALDDTVQRMRDLSVKTITTLGDVDVESDLSRAELRASDFRSRSADGCREEPEQTGAAVAWL